MDILKRIDQAQQFCKQYADGAWSTETEKWNYHVTPEFIEDIRQYIESLQLKLMHEQTQQNKDAVAWRVWTGKRPESDDLEYIYSEDGDGQPLYTSPAPAQPVSNQVIEKLDELAAQPVPQDGWLQDGGLLYRLTDGKKPVNRDEINVTMADGFRTPEARARRAGELLDRIRSTSPAQPALKPLTDEQILKTANAIDGFIWHEGMASERGVLDVEAIQFARAIEAAYGIKGQS